MDPEQEFMEAVKAGDTPRARALLVAQPRLAAARGEAGVSAVLLAIYHGQPALADIMIATGLALDIFEAAAAGRAERVAALLDGDPALINAHAPDGFTPLGLAAYFGQVSTLELLLARGADPNLPARNNSRVAPLHSAVAGGNAPARLAMAAALLAHGAQVNARQEGGFTPLHAAADNGDAELARLLLAHGAEPELVNDDGLSPAALARQNGLAAVADLLSPERR